MKNNYFKNIVNEAYVRPQGGLTEKQVFKQFENDVRKAVVALAKISQKRYRGTDWEDALQDAADSLTEVFQYMDLY